MISSSGLNCVFCLWNPVFIIYSCLSKKESLWILSPEGSSEKNQVKWRYKFSAVEPLCLSSSVGKALAFWSRGWWFKSLHAGSYFFSRFPSLGLFFVHFWRLVLVKPVNRKVHLIFFSLLIFHVQVVKRLRKIASWSSNSCFHVAAKDFIDFAGLVELKKQSFWQKKKLTCLDRESNPWPLDLGPSNFVNFKCNFRL